MQPAVEQDERLARLRLIRTQNVGPVSFGRLIDRFGSAQAALEALPEVAARAGRKKLRIPTVAEAERELAGHREIRCALCHAGRYRIPDPAARNRRCTASDGLGRRYCAAPASSNCNRRRETRLPMAEHFANGSPPGLGQAGITVVSGLARGIDAEAHAATIDTGTVAVIAGGIDNFYPPENERLQRQIAEQGLIIAESPFGTQPRARHFPRRNRIISGLSVGVTVIEAALRSGSLITARQAGEQGRDVFAVPGSPLDPSAAGANQVDRDGASLIETADDILDQIGPAGLFEERPVAVAIQPAPEFPAKFRPPMASQDDRRSTRPFHQHPSMQTPLFERPDWARRSSMPLFWNWKLPGRFGAGTKAAGNRYALLVTN